MYFTSFPCSHGQQILINICFSSCGWHTRTYEVQLWNIVGECWLLVDRERGVPAHSYLDPVWNEFNRNVHNFIVHKRFECQINQRFLRKLLTDQGTSVVKTGITIGAKEKGLLGRKATRTHLRREYRVCLLDLHSS